MKITDLPPHAIIELDSLCVTRTVDVNIKTITSPNSREFHFARARRVMEERTEMRRSLLGQTVPTLPVVVTFTRRSTQVVDDDNLPTASKGLRDEIAKLYGTSDKPGSPIRWFYEQAKCKRGSEGVTVLIETPERFALRATA